MSEGVEALDAGLDGKIAVTEPERIGAIVRLRDRYASDELSLDEFSRALDEVLVAQSAQELSRASPSREVLAPASRDPRLGAEALDQHLWPGEEVLWIGRPEGKLNLTRGSISLIVPFIAFAGFFGAIAVPSGAPILFVLFGFLLLGVGAYNVMGRVVLQGHRTIYAVTTRRIIRVIRGSSGDQTDSKLLRTIPQISVINGKHDRGTVTFGDRPAGQRSNGLSVFDPPSATDVISFVKIAEPASVARLIGSLQAYEQTGP